MNSYIFLSISDRTKANDFILSRNREITQFSFSILLIRMAFFGVMSYDYFTGQVSLGRWRMTLIAIIVHLTLILLCWRFPLKLQRFHSPLVIFLCYSSYLLNSTSDYIKPTRALSTLVAMIIYSNFTAIIINLNWILTASSTLVLTIGSSFFFIWGLNYDTT
jgi:hypothetical protein